VKMMQRKMPQPTERAVSSGNRTSAATIGGTTGPVSVVHMHFREGISFRVLAWQSEPPDRARESLDIDVRMALTARLTQDRTPLESTPLIAETSQGRRSHQLGGGRCERGRVGLQVGELKYLAR
jgi:hypothetical protein